MCILQQNYKPPDFSNPCSSTHAQLFKNFAPLEPRIRLFLSLYILKYDLQSDLQRLSISVWFLNK